MPHNIVEKKFIVINHLDKPKDSRAILWLKLSSESALLALFEKYNIDKNQNGLYKKKIILKNNKNVDDFTISLESHPKDASACVLRLPKKALKITERKNAHPDAEILEPYRLASLNHMQKILPKEDWTKKIDIVIKFAKTGSPLEHTVLNLAHKKYLNLKEQFKNYSAQHFPKSKLLYKDNGKDNDTDKTSKKISNIAKEVIQKQPFLFYPRDVSVAQSPPSEQNQTENVLGNTKKQSIS